MFEGIDKIEGIVKGPEPFDPHDLALAPAAAGGGGCSESSSGSSAAATPATTETSLIERILQVLPRYSAHICKELNPDWTTKDNLISLMDKRVLPPHFSKDGSKKLTSSLISESPDLYRAVIKSLAVERSWATLKKYFLKSDISDFLNTIIPTLSVPQIQYLALDSMHNGFIDLCLTCISTSFYDSNYMLEDSTTLLHHACTVGEERVVMALVERDADPSIKNSNYYNSIHLAAASDNPIILKATTDKQLDFTLCSTALNGENILHIALKERAMKSVDFILNLAIAPKLLLQKDLTGFNPFCSAIYMRQTSCLDRMLTISPEIILSQTPQRTNAAHLAALANIPQLIETIHVRASEDPRIGSLIHAKDKWGNTPLHYCFFNGEPFLEVVTALIGAGASTIEENSKKHTPWTLIDYTRTSAREIERIFLSVSRLPPLEVEGTITP